MSRDAGGRRRRSGDRPGARQRGAWSPEDDEYARRRAEQARRRAAMEREAFDPAPPDEDDWTVADEAVDRVRRVTAPSPVGDALDAVVRRRGWRERLHGTAIWARWTEVVGPELARHCEPVRLAGGTLVVRAENEVWASQLRYLVGQLQQNAAEVLGPGRVREVRIVVGPLTADGGDAAAPS